MAESKMLFQPPKKLNINNDLILGVKMQLVNVGRGAAQSPLYQTQLRWHSGMLCIFNCILKTKVLQLTLRN